MTHGPWRHPRPLRRPLSSPYRDGWNTSTVRPPTMSLDQPRVRDPTFYTGIIKIREEVSPRKTTRVVIRPTKYKQLVQGRSLLETSLSINSRIETSAPTTLVYYPSTNGQRTAYPLLVVERPVARPKNRTKTESCSVIRWRGSEMAGLKH